MEILLFLNHLLFHNLDFFSQTNKGKDIIASWITSSNECEQVFFFLSANLVHIILNGKI